MVQVDKGPEGISPGELPRRLMVSDEITGFVDRLLAPELTRIAGLTKVSAYRAVRLQ